MAIITKRTIMSLFSNDDVYSHQVRIVLAEKGVNVDIIAVRPNEVPSELREVNPYETVPTLLDRELALYESRIIVEYLDERFPHPPLLPVYPVARAEARKMMHRIDLDWYSLLGPIRAKDMDAKKRLMDSIFSLDPIFGDKPYFLSEEFSLLDAAIIPLLWRFPQLGIEVPSQYKGLIGYMQRLFARPAILSSLSDSERRLREAS